jgi:tetratricopeptide (TPR) repeat protein
MNKPLSLKLIVAVVLVLGSTQVMAQSVESLMSNGQELLQRGAYSQAVTSFRQALSHEPDLFEAQFNIGFAYLQWGHQTEAIQELKKALKMNPRSSEAWSNLAMAYDNLGKPEDAMGALAQAVTYNPENITARMNLAAMYANANHHQQAIAQYKQVIKMDGSNGEALCNLAKSLTSTGAYAEAKGYFKQAIGAEPTKGEPHAQLGDIYWKKDNDLDKAIGEYKLAIAAEPTVAEFYEALAPALEAKKKTDEAIEMWKKAQMYVDDAMKKEKIQDKIDRLQKGPEAAAGPSGSSGSQPTSTISKEQTKDFERSLRPEKTKETRTLETQPVNVGSDFAEMKADTGSWDLTKEAKKRAQEKKAAQIK